MKGKAGKEKKLWRKPAARKTKRSREARSDARLKKFAENAEEGRCYTLHEIAKAMGVTRERVRQIQQKATMKLHKRFTQMFKTENLTPDQVLSVFSGRAGGFEHDTTEDMR